MLTVTRAEVSGDLQHAKVYVSVMGTPGEQQRTLRGLQHAAGFVQSKLARRLQTRFTPVLRFVLDEGVKKSIEMSRLIHEALGKPASEEAAETETETDEEVTSEHDDESSRESDAADGSTAAGPAGP
jgi:ribosome-binding factor A